jgi:hypothetical protein
MFTRSSPAEPKSRSADTSANGAFSAVGPESTEKSVIGNDLKIMGQGLKIIGRGVLQVDGEIEGDVQAAEIIVGEKGQVTGMVAGRQVVVRGGLLILRGWAQVVSRSTLRHPTVQIAARQPTPMQLGVGQFEQLLV